MTLFYDPLTKKTHPWVLPSFIIAAIIVVVIIWVIGQGKAGQRGPTQEAGVDIFAR